MVLKALVIIIVAISRSSTSPLIHLPPPYLNTAHMFIPSQKGNIQTHVCRWDAQGKQSAKGLMTSLLQKTRLNTTETDSSGRMWVRREWGGCDWSGSGKEGAANGGIDLEVKMKGKLMKQMGSGS